MIVHLSAAGVPVSWSVTALYRSSYGVALNSAQSWYDRSVDQEGERPRDEPQCVIELEGDDENGWAVKRSDLMMSGRHLARQSPDDGGWLVQTHGAPLPMGDALDKAVTEALHARLVEFGYLIPRAEWQARYPAQALIARRFADFNAAHDAWRAGHPDRDDAMPFEPRWAIFMEAPKGHRPAYSLGEDCVCELRSGGRWSRIDPPELKDMGDHAAQVRLLNSGWTPAEVAVLLAEEPVG